MKVPENILNLLKSNVHEDRAIGIMLLEQIPNYLSFFKPTKDTTTPVIVIGKKQEHPTTRVNSKACYWVNTKYIYKWEGEDLNLCPWTNADHNITL